MAHNDKKSSKPRRDFVRQLIRALVVLAVAVTVFIISGSKETVERIKKAVIPDAAVTVSVKG